MLYVNFTTSTLSRNANAIPIIAKKLECGEVVFWVKNIIPTPITIKSVKVDMMQKNPYINSNFVTSESISIIGFVDQNMMFKPIRMIVAVVKISIIKLFVFTCLRKRIKLKLFFHK